MATVKFEGKKDIYQFRIDIKNAKPAIWRRVLIENTRTFHELHILIQAVFGWDNSHLYQFMIDRDTIITDTTNPYHEPYFYKEYNDKKTKLSKFFKSEGDMITYVYDFGDDWEHTIKLEKILQHDSKKHYPFLVTGKRATPPEDCGGIWGHERICYFLGEEEDSPEKEEVLEYYEGYDPEDFSKEEIAFVNELLKNWDNDI